MESSTVMIIDGMALLFRAYYASAVSGYIQRTSSGLPTNAVHGFVKYMLDAADRFRPSHIVCCWDMGSRTFRTDMYPAYKQNREEPPEELIPQFDLVKEVVTCFRIPNVGVPGYEADDCIGTLAARFERKADVLVLTGDHDLLQIVSERTKVVIMKKGPGAYAVYDPETLFAEKQLKPEQIVDWKGLIGDASDNYPGVKGIGEKTATKLLRQFESVEGILANLPALAKGVRAKLEAGLDMLHLSRELARIRRDVPLECELAECRWSPDFAEVSRLFAELEFKGLQKRIANRLTG